MCCTGNSTFEISIQHMDNTEYYHLSFLFSFFFFFLFFFFPPIHPKPLNIILICLPKPNFQNEKYLCLLKLYKCVNGYLLYFFWHQKLDLKGIVFAKWVGAWSIRDMYLTANSGWFGLPVRDAPSLPDATRFYMQFFWFPVAIYTRYDPYFERTCKIIKILFIFHYFYWNSRKLDIHISNLHAHNTEVKMIWYK